jgi:hypothetical protein
MTNKSPCIKARANQGNARYHCNCKALVRYYHRNRVVLISALVAKRQYNSPSSSTRHRAHWPQKQAFPHDPAHTYVIEVTPPQETPVQAIAGGSQGSTLALAWLCHPWVMPVHPIPLVAVYRFTSPWRSPGLTTA